MTSKSKRPVHSAAPTEPSPESRAKLEKAQQEAQDALNAALKKLGEGKEAAAEVARKIEKELVRRRSTPGMSAVQPPRKK